MPAFVRTSSSQKLQVSIRNPDGRLADSRDSRRSEILAITLQSIILLICRFRLSVYSQAVSHTAVAMPPSIPYPYPNSNSEWIQLYDLDSHFEGGYFKQTIALTSHAGAQHASGSGTELLKCSSPLPETSSTGNDATCIYYLLTPDSSRGRMHMNDNAVSGPGLGGCSTLTTQTFHIHHAGRALYTLIAPSSDKAKRPNVQKVVMGSDISKGEVTQLFVPGGWWKASEIPEDDLRLLDSPQSEDLHERIGCLISEVVVPGWTIDQHSFLTQEKVSSCA